MPNKVVCKHCRGEGSLDVLVSPHDDKKERVVCRECNGTGVKYQMTEEEERDYHDNYW